MKCAWILCWLLLLTPVLAAQHRYDVIIDEVMADPSPPLGLPNNEWIELKNISNSPVNLQGWRIGDSGGQSGPMPDFILEPYSFVIVCAGSAVAALSAFGNTISVTSFPSLDNDGELLLLKAPNDLVIHAVNYATSWYQNELKKEGGWTLEMIDTQNPCTGSSNWKASNSGTGGTPGIINSVDAANIDQSGPQLKNAYTIGDTTIILVFDEPLDSLQAAAISNYSIDGGLLFISAEALSPSFNLVQLKTNNALSPAIVFTVSVKNIADCKGNEISIANTARVGLATDALAGDGIINEILFNPRPVAFDYAEFYNNSGKIFDAAKLFIANRNSNGVIGSIIPLSTVPFYFFPGDYIVATENAANLALNYLVKKPEAILTISSLPSFPDDKGSVLLLNQHGTIVDEVGYSDDWHFKLIDNAEAVALERIDPGGPSQDAANWHSAASTAGYGTPGYKNSQFKNLVLTAASIEVIPKIFSPDNDGFDDIATIQYKTDQPGYVANVIIFDAAGRPIRNLVRNGTLSITGSWNWDGLDDKGSKLTIGTYIIFAEIFNLQGKKDQFKNIVVLARKLN